MRSSSWLMSCMSPCLKMGWSSTMRILCFWSLGGLSCGIITFLSRCEGAGHQRTPEGVRLDLQGGIDHPCPVVHDPQAYAGHAGNILDPDAVVQNGQGYDPAGVQQVDGDFCGLAVLDRIVEGLLGDIVEVCGKGVVLDRDMPGAVEDAGDPEDVRCACRELLQ